MGRAPKYDESHLLDAVRRVAAEKGPGRVTIAAVARAAGAPVGSIYHRYRSRDELVGRMWLRLVEEFQTGFLRHLEADGEPVSSGVAALRFIFGWVRGRPEESRIMLLHRREDFVRGDWPVELRRRAAALEEDGRRAFTAFARRLCGRVDEDILRGLRFALVDLPKTGYRDEIETGVPATEAHLAVVEAAARAALEALCR